MKVIIEFELPKDQDAFLDAVNATKWKELAARAEAIQMVKRDTAENPDHRKSYDEFMRWFRAERQSEGLTFATEAALKKSRSRGIKFWKKQLEDYLEKEGIAEIMAEIENEPDEWYKQTKEPQGQPHHKKEQRKTSPH